MISFCITKQAPAMKDKTVKFFFTIRINIDFGVLCSTGSIRRIGRRGQFCDPIEYLSRFSLSYQNTKF